MKKLLSALAFMLLGVTSMVAQSISHTVKRGESLQVIAQKYGVTVEDIKALNPNLGSTLYVGTVIYIPSSKKEISDSQAAVERPQSAEMANVKSSTSTDDEEGWNIYVKAGLNLVLSSSSSTDETLAGTITEFGVSHHLTNEAILFLGLGYAYGSKHESSVSTYMNRFIIPANVGYRVWTSEDGKYGFLPYAGLYIDWAFSAYSQSGGKKYKLSDNDSFRSVILGANIGASFKIKRWAIYTEFGYGLAERLKDVRQNYWSLGASFMF